MAARAPAALVVLAARRDTMGVGVQRAMTDATASEAHKVTQAAEDREDSQDAVDLGVLRVPTGREDAPVAADQRVPAVPAEIRE